MATSSMIHVRVDDKIKLEATETLASMGLSLSDAVHVFLTRVVVEKQLPFALKVPNPETHAAMMEADAIASGREARLATDEELFNGSRVLDAVNESAKGLFELGLINKSEMQKIQVISLQPIPRYDYLKIKALRERLGLSQSYLAMLLNISVSSVRKWELGETNPRGPSLKLLDLLDRKGLDVLI